MENNILIEESWVDKTRGLRVGDSGIYETFTSDKGELYRSLQREYGRCISKVHIDTDNRVKSIGWVFEKKQKYDDVNEYYIQETWVTLHESQPTRTIEHHYKHL